MCFKYKKVPLQIRFLTTHLIEDLKKLNKSSLILHIQIKKHKAIGYTLH